MTQDIGEQELSSADEDAAREAEPQATQADDEEADDEANSDAAELPVVPGIPDDIRAKYQVYEWRNAGAVLRDKRPGELDEIYAALREFTFKRSEILRAGKNRSLVTKKLDGAFYSRGWVETVFDTEVSVKAYKRIKGSGKKKKPKEGEQPQLRPTIFAETYQTPTHNVDCFKNKVALEIEWNNKDPFFDRDLNNFRLLFDLRAVDVGVIVTKSDSLIPILKNNGKLSKEVWDKYGKSTTWFGKLKPRIDGGGAGGCPVLVFAIDATAYDKDVADDDIDAFPERAAAEDKAAAEAKAAAWEAEKAERKRLRAEATKKRQAEKAAEKARLKAELAANPTPRARRPKAAPPASSDGAGE